MSIDQNQIQPIKDILTKANDVFVIFPHTVDPDTIASAIGLFHALEQTEKNLLIASPQPVDGDKYPLPQINQVTQSIGNRNLVISLKVSSRDNIDKVSYNLDEDNQTFNLVIQPKKGYTPLKSDNVVYSYSGAQADLIFIVGAQRLEDLGELYQAEKKVFDDATTVSLNRLNTSKFAQYHLDDKTTSSLSELTGLVVEKLGLQFDQDSATSLLFGVDQATTNLQHPAVSADTFELVAKLLRVGGTRLQAISQIPSPAAPPDPNRSNIPQEWLTPKIYKGSADRS
jgi:nanoRNase/pAp phosphatase (c-di-AMP/oligoRNAs hydrolase)